MNESIRRHLPADQKASAVAEVEQLRKAGKTVRAAVEEVAYRTGMGERTLFTLLSKTKGRPEEEWKTTVARKPSVPRPRIICHPEALRRFIDLSMTGRHVSKCFRQVVDEAVANGWGPLPSLRTMRRELDRHHSSSERWLAARAPKPRGEV